MARRRDWPETSVDITGLVDLAFLMVVFFILVGRITAQDLAPLRVPEPARPMTEPPGRDARLVVNVLPASPTATASWQVAGDTLPAEAASEPRLEKLVEAALEQNPQVELTVRADRRARWEEVRPVLSASLGAASARGLPQARMRLVARRAWESP